MTVLNVVELTKTAPAIKWIAAGCILSILSSFIIGISTAGKGKRGDTITTCSFVLLIISFFGAVICAALSDEIVVSNGKYQYEIIIDDNTSFTEVTEKYDIIEQRGEIFVVEERENESSY